MHSFGRAFLAEWLLDPEVVHLNHGTVGATPRRVLAAQRALQDEMERNPARFMLRELSGSLAGVSLVTEPRLRRAAREVAVFFGVRGEDLVFVDNTTSAINAVVRSLELRPGDEIILFDHGYGAVRKAAEYVSQRRGAHVRCVPFPFPNTTTAALLRALEDAITPKTRLAILDHITSPSAVLVPLVELAELCHRRGVPVLADGAHAPGAIALDIAALGVDWYTGNLHKWCWAPRSSALLWATPARQTELHPTTLSWGLGQGMIAEFDWVGTRDPTPHLSAPVAIEWLRELGVARVHAYNHELASYAARKLSADWGTTPPVTDSLLGAMACVQLPAAFGSTPEDATRLRDRLLFEDQIELHVQAFGGAIWVRVSAQIYNDVADIERLSRAILRRL